MSEPKAHSSILVVPSEFEEAASGAKFLGRGARAAVKIDVDTIQNSLSHFMSSIEPLIARIPELKVPYSVDEIEITVEVNAEGRIQLVGGISAGAGGGITLKLKKSSV